MAPKLLQLQTFLALTAAIVLWIPSYDILVLADPSGRILYHWQPAEPISGGNSNNGSPKKQQPPPPYGAQSPSSSSGTLHSSDCGPACSKRCSATHHLNACMYFCEYCCARCLCVPPGTYGNKQSCPCYNNMTTKEGKPKCP